MQPPLDAATWESYGKRLARGDIGSVRAAATFARKAFSTPKGIVAYASSLTFGMPGQAAHGWFLRIGDTDALADALGSRLVATRSAAAWSALARGGLDLAVAQADAVMGAAPITDDAAARLHFPVTPPTVRLRTMQTAVAYTLEAIAGSPQTRSGTRAHADLQRNAATLASDIRAAAQPGAGPATPEVILLRWRRLRPRLVRLRDSLPNR
ncbi:MAG: hypothetical protein ACKO5K_03055 [Armatimonadota bacterium]